MDESGILNRSYHLARKTKKSLKYRLQRRTKEVLDSIQRHFMGTPSIILDLGTADGLMLGMIKDRYPSAQCMGIDLSKELLEMNTDDRLVLVQGHVNLLPVQGNTVDIIIATAVIEHIPNPEQFLHESKRVLKPQGLVILTSPDPLWEKLATMTGHLQDEQHCNVMSIRELAALFREAGYSIVDEKKFMLSPVGIPFERSIENAVRKLGLHFLFANQILVGRK